MSELVCVCVNELARGEDSGSVACFGDRSHESGAKQREVYKNKIGYCGWRQIEDRALGIED